MVQMRLHLAVGEELAVRWARIADAYAGASAGFGLFYLEDLMDPEQAAITLGISVEEVADLAAAIGADPDDLGPEDLVAMASLLDAEDDEDEDDDA